MFRNILWNLFGTGTPLLAAFIAIPMLIEALGTSRFGVLTLAWLVVGYFSLFDLGLGRSITKLVAEKLGAGKEDEIPGVVWSGMLLIVTLGVLGAIIMLNLNPWLVGSVLKIPDELYLETLTAFYLLGASIPIVIFTTGLRGILEAHQRFDVVNIIRFPLGILTFFGPLAVLPFSNSLANIVLVLVFIRIIAWLAYLIICYKLYPELRQITRPDTSISKRLISFGMWMTVSNITGPVLLYLGRILIITMISTEAVAYFATPYEVVIRLLIIPGVLVSVIFPTLTHLFQKKPEDVATLYNKSLLYLFMVMLPVICVFYFFAEDGLAWWINTEFSQHGYRVAQYLSLGVFINSFGHISQALIQGYGRPDLTAKLHLVELVLYIPYLWLLIEQFGIDGAAIAWVIRVAISTVVLLYMARRCLSGLITVKY
ncbi:MAG TPA: flippase [Gammaproteobacteria bacterium]|nr:flippase [Gammaproteobacteria bacterium]